jgi:hypothetical protein
VELGAHERFGFNKVWVDRNTGVLNFNTEVCNSGSLRDYCERHKLVSVRALKKWACKILALKKVQHPSRSNGGMLLYVRRAN